MIENILSFNRRADFALDSIPIQERDKFRREIDKLRSWNPKRKKDSIKPFQNQKNKYIYKLGRYLVFFDYNQEKNQVEVDDVIAETILEKFK